MIKFEKLLKETKVYKTLSNEAKEGKISQCVMIVSEDEVACQNLCLLIARMLLCEKDNCGKCKSCSQVENGVHPSLIKPESLNAEGLKDFVPLCFKKVDTRYKVLLISNFEDIKLSEQNRLLKLIEEPTENTVFIIGVSNINSVLETIKSRAAKYTLDRFDDEALKEALLDEYDAYNVEKAMAFAEGSITNAINIIVNPDFIVAYENIAGILNDMQKSGGLLEMVNRIPFRSCREFDEKKKLLVRHLDAFELVLKQVFENKTEVKENSDDIIKQISEKYNVKTLVNVEDLVIDAKRKADLNCDPEGIFYQLLMSILEVKFKCQL